MTAFDSGHHSIPLATAMTCAALLYLRGWLYLGSKSPRAIPARRIGGCLLGLALVWAALASPLASCDAGSLTGHMVQHLLLMTIAPPLILLGEPLLAIRHALPHRIVRSVVSPILMRPPMQRLGGMLALQALCWLAATATLVIWHVPAVFALALRSQTVHAIEQASFLGTGVLFWWPVVRPWPSAATAPRWSTVLYLFLATLPCDILSGFLVFSDRVAYSMYVSHGVHSGLSALEDQQRAGALMWTCVTIVYLVAGTVLSARLLAVQGAGEASLVQRMEVK